MNRTKRNNANVNAPWGTDPSMECSVGSVPDFKVKAPWIHGSSVLRDEEERKKTMPPYKINNPWDQHSVDIMDEFDKRLAAEEYHIAPAPWDKSTAEVPPLSAQAKEYKYVSLHDPIPMSEARRKQLADYVYNPPYTTELNETIPPSAHTIQGMERRTTPKAAPKLCATPPTLAPWKYGEMEPLSSRQGKRINHKAKDTALWTVPPEELQQKMTGFVMSGDPIVDKLRMKLHESGTNGILSLGKKFRIMDDDGSGALDFLEFTKAMNECMLGLTKPQIQHLFMYFDKDDDGTISYDEFLIGIRGVLSDRRKATIKQAFDILDRDGSGVVELNDLIGVYDASQHPEVVARKKTKEDILKEMIANMETCAATRDGKVTLSEFEEYYAAVSASIDSDDYFELMMRNAWHISGGEGWCANTSNRRVLVTHADGRQSVEEIKNDLGVRGDDKDEMMRRLSSQGVSASKIDMTYGEKQMDRPKTSGSFQRRR